MSWIYSVRDYSNYSTGKHTYVTPNTGLHLQISPHVLNIQNLMVLTYNNIVNNNNLVQTFISFSNFLKISL